jgi:hypothetical protein
MKLDFHSFPFAKSVKKHAFWVVKVIDNKQKKLLADGQDRIKWKEGN